MAERWVVLPLSEDEIGELNRAIHEHQRMVSAKGLSIPALESLANKIDGALIDASGGPGFHKQ